MDMSVHKIRQFRMTKGLSQISYENSPSKKGPVANSLNKTSKTKKLTNLRVEQIHPFCVPTKRIFYPIKLHPHQTKPRQIARFPVYCKVYGYCTQMPAGKIVSPSSVFLV